MPIPSSTNSPLKKPLRIGAVSYLNSKPLVRGLGEALPGAEVSFDLPSRLADDLAQGRLDVALIPLIEHLRQPSTQIVSNACVACCGPVLSVKVYFRTPPEQVRTLALDEGSRTSAALTRLLLSRLHQVAPAIEPLAIGTSLEQTTADAVLLIGDRAMHPPAGDFVLAWDLGEQWNRWTGLPFVFATWVARADASIDTLQLAATLQAVRDRGLRELQAIAAKEAAPLGLPTSVAHNYLLQNLHFTLGPEEQQGVDRYARECRDLGLLELPPTHLPSNQLAYDDCTID